ncbi:Uncharacterised protein [Kingella potus]|uniref:MtN3/saliva family n=2 Tax=Kingella potus TaxID=265175 RepID=A0A377R6S7_9NEIS|nr:Uncharacterised protein [Kingella potus]
MTNKSEQTQKDWSIIPPFVRLRRDTPDLPGKKENMTEKQMKILSVVATITAVGMYVSYIPQIQNNLNGQPGSWLQPLVAAVNCTLWVAYGLLKKQRDWPVALANAPGIFLGLITFITSIMTF